MIGVYTNARLETLCHNRCFLTLVCFYPPPPQAARNPQLAAAAGLKLGAVRGVIDSYYATGNTGVSWIGTSSYGGTFSSTNNGGSGTQYSFTANVTFSVAQ